MPDLWAMISPNKQAPIPVHKLSDSSDLGLVIHRVPGDKGYSDEHMHAMGLHRDDHCIFLFHQSGRSRAMIDFEDYTFEGKGLYFILPGQVHQVLELRQIEGWFLAVDAHFIPDPYRPVLEEVLTINRWLPLVAEEGGDMQNCLDLIWQREKAAAEGQLFAKSILYSLLDTFMGLVAERYACQVTSIHSSEPRAMQVTRQFRALAVKQFRAEKRPAAYAATLNLSLSYLNEMVKATTGFPVGYWIQYEVMLEARRLLCHSGLSIKEVAYALGYEDPTYFSRAFKNVVDLSPARFRQLFHG